MTFPDFPGCVSVGDSIEHVIEHSHDALAAHMELMLEDGGPAPEPSPIDAPLPDWLEDLGEVALRTLIRVDLPGRTVRLSITMDEALGQRRRPGSRRAGLHPLRFSGGGCPPQAACASRADVLRNPNAIARV